MVRFSFFKRLSGSFKRKSTSLERESSTLSDFPQPPLDSDVWLPNEENVWELATIVSQVNNTTYTMKMKKDGSVVEIDLASLPCDPHTANPRTADDMTSLYHIHEPGVLHNLRERAKVEDPHPYTFVANVLIAVNPLQRLVDPPETEYHDKELTDASPHPYAIAESAFYYMARDKKSQSVVISGESGAGKTESSKIVLRYVANRGVHSHVDGVLGLDKRLIDTNPILESFGNATTLRNHNSSRFGKFMKLQFLTDSTNEMVGASIVTYLLERSRLVYQIEGERNFHIFYFLICGASAALKSDLKLRNVADYAYLSSSSKLVAEGIDDAKEFRDVVEAFKGVGVDEAMQRTIWGVLAGLLHLGNVKFEPEDTEEGEKATVKGSGDVETASSLLGVDPAALEQVLTRRHVRLPTTGEMYIVRRDVKEAVFARDAVAKDVYNSLFLWIVSKINGNLGKREEELPFIGILDIFGFESFKMNDFEQLLINFANESLQATFNKHVFMAEQELYAKEALNWKTIAWPDNRECINLIAAKKPAGIIAQLDTICRMPKTTDRIFNQALHKHFKGHEFFPPPHPRDVRDMFKVRHFAGDVTYTVGNFLVKNDDSIPKDMLDLFTNSGFSLYTEMFHAQIQQAADAAAYAAGTASRRKGPMFSSVSSKFVRQMDKLVLDLDATRCNFIRCIKPNPTMTHGVFHNHSVVEQLRCTGMLQTCELLKVGYPTRLTYPEMIKIYGEILPQEAQDLFKNETKGDFTAALMWSFRVDKEAYQLGLTKIFFRAGQIVQLDGLLQGMNEQPGEVGPFMVKRLARWLVRRRWRRAIAKTKTLNRLRRRQELIRAQNEFRKAVGVMLVYTRTLRPIWRQHVQDRSACKIQALFRMRHVYKMYQQMHVARLQREKEAAAATVIQSLARVRAARKLARELRRLERERAATVIAARVRGMLIWKWYQGILKERHERKVDAAIRVQAMAKMLQARKEYQAMVALKKDKAACRMQAVLRGRLARVRVKRMRHRRAQLAAIPHIQKIVRGFLARKLRERIIAENIRRTPYAKRVQRWFRIKTGNVRMLKVAYRALKDKRDFEDRCARYLMKMNLVERETVMALTEDEMFLTLGYHNKGDTFKKRRRQKIAGQGKKYEMLVMLSVGIAAKRELYSCRTAQLKRTPGYFKDRFGEESKVDFDRNGEGHYLIERPYIHFPAIIDYIRDGACAYPTKGHVPTSADTRPATTLGMELDSLLEEAAFYRIDNMVRDLIPRARKAKFYPDEWAKYAPKTADYF